MGTRLRVNVIGICAKAVVICTVNIRDLIAVTKSIVLGGSELWASLLLIPSYLVDMHNLRLKLNS